MCGEAKPNKILKNAALWAAFCLSTYLNESGSFERLKGAILCNRAECFCRNVDRNMAAKLGHVDALLLAIWLASGFAARIKLRRTCAI